jgi:hypothetical protein
MDILKHEVKLEIIPYLGVPPVFIENNILFQGQLFAAHERLSGQSMPCKPYFNFAQALPCAASLRRSSSAPHGPRLLPAPMPNPW